MKSKHRRKLEEFVKYFDYESVAREASIPDKKLRQLVKLVRQEFPHDAMMVELHVLRACPACLAVRDRHVQIDDALGITKS